MIQAISQITTPLGPLWAGFSHHALIILSFKPLQHPIPNNNPHPLEYPLNHWLERYFTRYFDPPTLPLAPQGTAFQQKIWGEVSKIPAGKWLTYGALAKQSNTAPRAIGQAMAANPIPLLIPCHRIIAKNGKIGGYSGGDGEKTKHWLLQWEGGELYVE
ncbi:MAG: methylated-DNA--[protein]-cysteine S-methyltransferase [Nitrospirae bacterium]|nr:methylated-DNA--[protein]-cysteine S-methyltransferase [Magnetococcales bacterium]